MLMNRDLTVQQLRCFVAVADEQQFTAAADSLHVAQPSISSQIHRLERILGATLFHRDQRPVALTDAGRALLPFARRVLEGLDDVLTAVTEVDEILRGQLTIGVTPSLGSTLLPYALTEFHRRHPGISLRVVERDSEEIATRLESGELDLAIAIMPLHAASLESAMLAVERLVVVVSHSHPLASRAKVNLADLDDVPLIMFAEGYDIRAATLAAFSRAGVIPTIALEGAEMGTFHAFVAAGMGAAIVPSLMASTHPNLHVLHLQSPVLERTIGLVQARNRVLSRAASTFANELTMYLGERGWPGRSHAELVEPGAPHEEVAARDA